LDAIYYKRLSPNFSHYDLHLAGPVEPEFKDHIKRFREENPSLNSRVIFHGSLDRDQLYSLYSRSKIFCLPSRFEGMAIVFPEAMYYGNAIVTTRDVSLRYLIERYRFGSMVEKDNSADLGEALLNVINDEELWHEMARRAKEISSTLLNWDNIVRMLEKEIDIRRSGKAE